MVALVRGGLRPGIKANLVFRKAQHEVHRAKIEIWKVTCYVEDNPPLVQQVRGVRIMLGRSTARSWFSCISFGMRRLRVIV